ncbi:MAG: hypothetical protein KDA38_00215 [Planctomycetales bacterium]|nr:hypothetical protein [Planctomycetales bacterium]
MGKRRGWRRFLRLRLATLLLLITAACLGLAFRQAYLAPYARQAVAVVKLREMGATVEFEPAQPEWLAPLVGRDEFQDVFRVHMEHRNVTDDQLNVLLDLPHVRYLYLAGNPITDEGVRNLLPLKNVRRLSLWRTNITDTAMEYISRNRDLEALDVHATAVSDEGLKMFERMPNLRELKLNGRITDEGLRHVAPLKRLVNLNIGMSQVTPAGMALVADCPIRVLDAPPWESTFRGEYLKHFRDWKYLATLPGHVYYCRDEHLRELPLDKLESLSISGSELTAAGLQRLIEAPRLTNLNVECNLSLKELEPLMRSRIPRITITTPKLTPQTQADFAAWNKPPRRIVRNMWETLRLRVGLSTKPSARLNGGMTARQTRLVKDWSLARAWQNANVVSLEFDPDDKVELEHIAALPNLQTLRLTGGEIAPAELAKLHAAPNLRDLLIHSLSLDDDCLREIAELPQLKSIDLSSPWFSESAVRAFTARMTPRARVQFTHAAGQWNGRLNQVLCRPDFLGDVAMKHLQADERMQVLRFHGLTNGEQLEKLAGLSNLRSLDVQQAWLHRGDWSALGEMKQLRHLDLAGSRLGDDAIVGLADFEQLVQLNLSGTQIGNRGLEAISRIESLEELLMYRYHYSDGGPWINDEGIRHLAAMPRLRKLHMVAVQITDASAESLVQIASLEDLDLRETSLTDAGLKTLAKHPGLRILDITRTQVTESGLAELANMPSLQRVSLPYNLRGSETARNLRQLRPGLRVN